VFTIGGVFSGQKSNIFTQPDAMKLWCGVFKNGKVALSG